MTIPRIDIKYASSLEADSWNGYVGRRHDASPFHLYGWRNIIQGAYGHRTYYLLAQQHDGAVAAQNGDAARSAHGAVGVLPLVHLKHRLFGNSLVSLPFLDGAGILADSREAEESLLAEAIRLGRRTGASKIELRHERILAGCADRIADCSAGPGAQPRVTTRSDKVRMLLPLPESSDMLMKSFKSKLRNQVAKPLKEGLTSTVGGVELLGDFYRVFLVNMRDLGSPVHSMDLMRRVLGEFTERSRILVIYKGSQPVAAALVIGFNGVLRNPWASSLRQFASLSPNMLLYLRMLEFACDNGYRVFDFGRSTKGEGTYRFKEQWGAIPAPLHWYRIALDGSSAGAGPERSEAERFAGARRYWRKLPLVVTKVIGPRIRKHISL